MRSMHLVAHQVRREMFDVIVNYGTRVIKAT